MSITPTPPRTAADVTFEVERFEWTSDARIELAGRWFGVRGWRFLRPTLEVEVDGHSRRLLALLEHKPWAAEDGEEWQAAFPWSGEPVELSASLAVGPDVAVPLPAPGLAGKAGGVRPARPRSQRPRKQELERELQDLRRKADNELQRIRAQVRAAEEEAATTEAELEATRGRLGAAESASDGLARERNAALAQLETARTERDAAVAERDAAVADRGAAVAARDAALRACEEAVAARDAALRDRDTVRAERNSWLGRARGAAAQRDAALVERDRAKADRDSALSERDATREAFEQAAGDARALGETDARPLDLPEPRFVPSPHPPDVTESVSRFPSWGARAGAMLALALLVVLVLLLVVWA